MSTFQKKSRGSVLIISLLILLLMTILGLSAMQSTNLQERMAGNMNDRNLAFQAAESAIAQAQEYIRGTPSPSSVGPLNNATRAETWETFFVTNRGGTPATITTDGSFTLADMPRYAIEELSIPSRSNQLVADEALPETSLYRITARGVGGTGSAVVILQANFIP